MKYMAGQPPWRRKLLVGAASALGLAAVSIAVRRALAQGGQPPGIYRIEGEVRIDGRPARPGQLVRPGMAVETGAGSQAVFVVGRDAFMLRAGSRLETSGADDAVDALRMVTGRVLSVFGSGAKVIMTATATIGIRGTGIYVESQPGRTYVCTCYGTAELQPRERPDLRESVATKHHEQPRYIYGSRSEPVNQMMEKAPVINHTDAELVLLESLVGRKPPFAESGAPPY